MYYQIPINKEPFPLFHKAHCKLHFLSSFFDSPMESPSTLGLILLLIGSLVCQAQARAFFVFGDSLVDNGNNDYLLTTARADNYPYGIDYPTRRPTGRFSNGYNIPDLIS